MNCTTHHYACKCREAYFDELSKTNNELIERIDLILRVFNETLGVNSELALLIKQIKKDNNK